MILRVVPPPYHSRGYSHQKKYFNGNPCPQIPFFSVLAFLCQTQQFFKSVLRFTSQLLFKNFPGGRIGEWTEAQRKRKLILIIVVQLFTSLLLYLKRKGDFISAQQSQTLAWFCSFNLYLNNAPITLSNYFNMLRTRDHDMYLYIVTVLSWG